MTIKQINHQLFGELRDKIKVSRQNKRAALLENQSCETINVMEFKGHIYIAHDNVPVVRADDLKVPISEALSQARADYLLWKKKFNK